MSKRVDISQLLSDNGLPQDITEEDFLKKTDIIANFPIQITSLEKVYVQDLEVYMDDADTRDAFIDMTI